VPVEYSRGLRLGAKATGRAESELEAALEASRVVVSADSRMPRGVLTLRVLLTTMRRGPGRLVLERGDLATSELDAIEEAVHAVDLERPLSVVRRVHGDVTVRLHVGPDCDRGVRLVPEGFGAHVAGQRSAVIRPRRPGNAIGAVFTAALGAAEAFKLTAAVLPARRVLHRHLRFCPLTLTPDLDRAPELPVDLVFDLALMGVGAIGTGIVLVLQAMDGTGRILLVDRQRFAAENLGTYSIGTAADVVAGPWKVDLAREALPRFDVVRFCGAVGELPEAIDAGRVPWFRTVLTALDTPEARRDAQRQWPDRLIDAATGDTVLGIHAYEHGGRCMFCVFPPERTGPSAAERLAEATGLSVARAMRGDDPLTKADLQELTPKERARLERHLGEPVCGLGAALGLTALDARAYQPSIPFVSLEAGCLAMARLVAHALAIPTTSNLVQYDALVGPQRLIIDQMDRLPGCTCQTRAAAIEQVRARRARG